MGTRERPPGIMYPWTISVVYSPVMVSLVMSRVSSHDAAGFSGNSSAAQT